MDQKPMASTMIGMSRDESVLILIKHCRDMKNQEARLRLFTLLLLLSCATAFIFTIYFNVRQCVNSGSDGQKDAIEQYTSSNQQQLCPADPQTNLQRPHILLRYVQQQNKGYMKWEVESRENFNTEENAIVIPQSGYYFIYVQIALVCYDVKSQVGDRIFHVELHKWNKGYNQTQHIIDASDTLDCIPGFRTVFVGQLHDFLQDDHVKVWIKESNALIRKASFGVFLK